jgi:arsenite methyltransferase
VPLVLDIIQIQVIAMPPRFVARQLAHPSGLLGRIFARLMNRHNAKMNAFAREMLAPSPADRVLEIGFGGGVNLEPLLRSGAHVTGVDRSDAMVARAAATFSDAVAAGRAAFHQGHVEALPFAAASFTRVCAVNTVYFWTSLAAGFAEIHRVLAPGGRAVIGFLPKERMDRLAMPTDIFTTRAPADVVAALAEAGFQNVRIERPAPDIAWNVVVAERP